MICRFSIGETNYQSELKDGNSLAIPLRPNHENPNCFYAPPLTANPVRVDNWVGSIKEGGKVNFFNIKINPHGNGTHTECYAHIMDTDQTIDKALEKRLYKAYVISLFPEKLGNGDRLLGDQAIALLEDVPEVDALVIRTLPNDQEKLERNYSGNNPTYFTQSFMQKIVDKNIQHLLVDLPSVDREEDGGKLTAHKTFWCIDEKIRENATITELIFVSDTIEDGIYLLDIGICALQMDVSPSRPILYKAYQE